MDNQSRESMRKSLLNTYNQFGAYGVIKVASENYLGNDYAIRAWELAMCAYYGPSTYLHPSHCDAHGCPTMAYLTANPGYLSRMAEARLTLERLLSFIA